LKALFLGDDTEPPQPDWIATEVKADPKLLPRVESLLASLRPKPNPEQLAAIMDTFTTTTALTLLQGPPGTGKTRVLMLIVLAHMLLTSRQIMVTAPTNEAVVNLVQAWESTVSCSMSTSPAHSRGSARLIFLNNDRRS
jgi:primosomal protein N'